VPSLLRRVLDVRLANVVGEIDLRLGSRANTRPPIHDRLDDLDRWVRETLAAVGELSAGRSRDELRPEVAEFLNRATGPEGYAAQAGLWFNPPVPVRHVEGGAEVLLVNERIVEQPFAFRALAGYEHVLDIGGGESTVGLSLASLGHRVHVVDPRGLALTHPNLEVTAARVDELGAGEFDAALALSSVEHFGLASYGGDADPAADRRALEVAHDRVRPGGRLVLTVPFAARASADDFQRVYDEASLDALLGPWRRTSLEVVGRDEAGAWRPGAGEPAVALVIAERG
jgi:SAM-dependent methyltransferase